MRRKYSEYKIDQIDRGRGLEDDSDASEQPEMDMVDIASEKKSKVGDRFLSVLRRLFSFSDSGDLRSFYDSPAYIFVVIGAIFLMQNVATWSFVWWMCVVIIFIGIPICIVMTVALFWYVFLVGVMLVIGMVIFSIIQHFIRNPF